MNDVFLLQQVYTDAKKDGGYGYVTHFKDIVQNARFHFLVVCFNALIWWWIYYVMQMSSNIWIWNYLQDILVF